MSGEVETTVGTGVGTEDGLEVDLWFVVFFFSSSFHSRSC